MAATLSCLFISSGVIFKDDKVSRSEGPVGSCIGIEDCVTQSHTVSGSTRKALTILLT